MGDVFLQKPPGLGARAVEAAHATRFARVAVNSEANSCC